MSNPANDGQRPEQALAGAHTDDSARPPLHPSDEPVTSRYPGPASSLDAIDGKTLDGGSHGKPAYPHSASGLPAPGHSVEGTLEFLEQAVRSILERLEYEARKDRETRSRLVKIENELRWIAGQMGYWDDLPVENPDDTEN